MIISFNNYPTTFNHNRFFKDVTEKDFPCGEIKEEKGIQVCQWSVWDKSLNFSSQRMEAMLYALDEINNDSMLLPNIRLI